MEVLDILRLDLGILRDFGMDSTACRTWDSVVAQEPDCKKIVYVCVKLTEHHSSSSSPV